MLAQNPAISWLGPLFCPSPVEDEVVKSQPSVVEQCFSGADKRRQGGSQEQGKAGEGAHQWGMQYFNY
jgi:hypothetical protein